MVIICFRLPSEMDTFPVHLSSPRFLISKLRVAKSFVFCVVFCR